MAIMPDFISICLPNDSQECLLRVIHQKRAAVINKTTYKYNAQEPIS